MIQWQGSYCGPAPAPADLFSRCNFNPFALMILAAPARCAGRTRPGVAGIKVLGFGFLSPLCALSQTLFSAWLVHHGLLIAVAAPLLALSRPARAPTGVGLAFLLAATALWLWHAPAAYDAALGNTALYWVMQTSLFG